jgi:hypothetical protein
LELRENLHRFSLSRIRPKEPLERIERELLDRGHGDCARPFARPVPAHAVGHEKQMCAFLSNLQLRFRQARLPDAHRFRELGDQKLILIVRTHLSFVGDSKGFHRE